MCDTQKFEVPPWNAMEGPGGEAREREAEGMGRKGRALELHIVSSFLCDFCWSCAFGAPENLQRYPEASCERKAVHQMRSHARAISTTLHKGAIAEMAEWKLASRFGALQDDQDDPEPEAETPASTWCVHRLIQTYCAGRMIVDARKLGTASKVSKTLRPIPFILRCKYCISCLYVSVRTVGDDLETVEVQLPLQTFKLLVIVAAALRDETNEVHQAQEYRAEDVLRYVVDFEERHCREDNQKRHQTEDCHHQEARFPSFVERRRSFEHRGPSVCTTTMCLKFLRDLLITTWKQR